MKELSMITAPDCVYCKKAKNLLERITLKYPQYASIDVHIIDASEAKEKNWEYQYLPCFYIDNKKIFEGYITIEKLLEIIDAACQSAGQSLDEN